MDITVCHSCYEQAKILGLDAKEIDLRDFFSDLRTIREKGV